MRLSRRIALGLPLALAACGGDDTPMVFAPLRYDYLIPLRLNVAELQIGEPPPPGPLDGSAPVPPGPALRQLLEDRLSAAGTSGRATVQIQAASIRRARGGLEGRMAVRLDIQDQDAAPIGFAEARVSRSLGDVGRDLRQPLYDLTKQMLGDMNVELEFQLRRALRDWLQTPSTAPTPAAVERQDLAPPPAAGAPAL